MPTSKSPTMSSTTSEVEHITNGRMRDMSETSHETQSLSQHGSVAVTNAHHTASMVETSTIRSNPSSTSFSSAGATGTPYDAVSLAASTNTGFNAMTGSQTQSAASIPIIAPPSMSNLSQQTMRVDVASAYQQYQQSSASSQTSPSSGSTISSSGASLSSPGRVPAPTAQPQYHTAQAGPNQAYANQYGSTGAQVYQQYTQSGQGGAGQYFTQQQQEQQSGWTDQLNNTLMAMDSSRDGMLHIDYGAIEAYNIAMQSSDDFLRGVVPPPGMGPPGQQPRFDAAKAIFNQVDVNHDGSISRDEFRQWASQGMVGGQQQYAQSYGNMAQMATNTISDANSFYAGANPEIANILRQSGLGQI